MGRRKDWFGVGLEAWSLSMEASAVVALRALKLSTAGPAAAVEAQRMVVEKMEAAAELQARSLSGALGVPGPRAASKALAHYRRKVRSNRRRLSKG